MYFTLEYFSLEAFIFVRSCPRSDAKQPQQHMDVVSLTLDLAEVHVYHDRQVSLDSRGSSHMEGLGFQGEGSFCKAFVQKFQKVFQIGVSGTWA